MSRKLAIWHDVPSLKQERRDLLAFIDRTTDAESIAISQRRIDKIEERLEEIGIK